MILFRRRFFLFYLLFLFGLIILTFDDYIHSRRDQLFAVTKDDLVRVAQTMLLPQLSTNQASVALLGGDGKDLDMMKQNGWKVVDM